jgi:hypothetical protein
MAGSTRSPPAAGRGCGLRPNAAKDVAARAAAAAMQVHWQADSDAARTAAAAAATAAAAAKAKEAAHTLIHASATRDRSRYAAHPGLGCTPRRVRHLSPVMEAG